MYRMPPHSHCEFATLFLSSCSFVSFKLPRRPRKEGKQKHLFTPLLSRRDLKGGSVLRCSDSFLNGPRFTPVHSQLVRGVLRLCVCVCDGKAGNGELFKASGSANLKRFEEGELHFMIFLVMAACVECVVVHCCAAAPVTWKLAGLGTPSRTPLTAVIPLLCMANLQCSRL